MAEVKPSKAAEMPIFSSSSHFSYVNPFQQALLLVVSRKEFQLYATQERELESMQTTPEFVNCAVTVGKFRGVSHRMAIKG